MTARTSRPSIRAVFVAGASGAIGRILCRLLVADGFRVVGTTRRVEAAVELRSIGVEPVVVDVFNGGALRDAVKAASPDTVIHQLTDLPRQFDAESLRAALPGNARLREVGTRNLVDACISAGVQHVIAQSIAFAYAPGAQPYGETAPLNLHASDPAAARTAHAVQVLETLVLGGPFRGVVLRYGKLYGPGTWTSTPPAGGPLHVDAAAHAARRAITRGSGVYNIAEPDGTVSVAKAIRELEWTPDFRAPLG